MRYFCRFWTLFLFCFSTAWATAPLSASEAFKLTASAKNDQTILLQWKIAPHYYLYQKQFAFRVIQPANAQLGSPIYPSNTRILKTSLGDFDVYVHTLTIPIPIIQPQNNNVLLQVKYQGCSKVGYCYPPVTELIAINLSGHYLQPVSPLNIDIAPEIPAPLVHQDKPSFLTTILGFFGFGILLSLTPCVLPMIPVLSSIIIGQNKKRAFFLSVFYVLGMALTYALVGMLFALLGKNLQTLFQQPWVIIAFSIIFIAMALSLFGLFTVQLPEKLRACIAEKSHHQKSGTYIGVFIMGCLSILILSPCVTPPLVAALGLISKSGDIGLGTAALFFTGVGMGVPLLFMGALGTKILPKPGKWMNIVKYFLGALLLWVAMSMLLRMAPSFHKTTALGFQSVHTISEMESALQSANNKPVLLDFSADWCIACQEFDTQTFSNPMIQKKLTHFVLLRVNLTKRSLENQMIERQYGVVAPPTIVFFYHRQEIPHSRVIGYMPPKPFLRHIDRIVSTTASN